MWDINLRAATIKDAEAMFAWRNAQETRRYSFNPKPLKMADHLQWLSHSLALDNRRLLIAEHLNEAIGVLRFDIDKKEQAEISIYLVPGLSGRGWGTRLLEAGIQWIKNHLPEVKLLVAKIAPENIGSCRAFAKSGFQQVACIYERVL